MRRNKEFLYTLLLYSPLFVVILIMIPRLLSAHFGLFDDGNTIMNAQLMLAGKNGLELDASHGRFRPAYWLYYFFIYLMTGKDPLAFFLGNTIVFVVITAGLIYLVKQMGGTNLQAWASGLLFALSGPIIENFYTLSKSELLLALGIILALDLVSSFKRLRAWWFKGIVFILATLALLISYGAKETTLVMIPVGLAWIMIGWWFQKHGQFKTGLGSRILYIVVVLLATVVFLLAREMLVPVATSQAVYSAQYSLTSERILSAAVRWAGWLLRDFPYLIPLVLFLLVWVIKFRNILMAPYYFDALVWMGAWVVIYLPWFSTNEYFLLPFALGCSVFCGLAIGQLITGIAGLGKLGLTLSSVCLAITVFLVAITILNNITTARMQLSVDAVNTELIDYLSSNVPQNGKVYVNLPKEAEYYDEIRLHLKYVQNRQDISVDNYSAQILESITGDSPSFILVTPLIENQPAMTSRMGFSEINVKQWNQSLHETMPDIADPVYMPERQFHLLNTDYLKLLCPFFKTRNYCSGSNSIIDQRMFTYGWGVYVITPP